MSCELRLGDWTLVLRGKTGGRQMDEISIELTHPTFVPNLREVSDVSKGRILLSIGTTSSAKRKFDSCWAQESETQSDGEDETEDVVPHSPMKLLRTESPRVEQTDIPEASPLALLPNELLVHILHFLPPLEIFKRVQLVSRAWHDIIAGDTFWRYVYDHHVGPAERQAKHDGWAEACKLVVGRSLHFRQMCKEAEARKRELWKWKEFFWFCKKGYIKLAKPILSSDDGVRLNVNAQEKEQDHTALMAASINGYLDVVKLLCSYGATIDIADRHGITALMYAAREGHLEIVKTLIRSGADVNAKTNNGSTSLMIAAKEGHYAVVEFLLQHGAIDISNQNGSTALTFAAEKARCEAVRVLIKHNTDVNARTNKRGITPLIFAVKARDLQSARMLLEAGADVNARTLRTKYTALIAAVHNKDMDMVRLLLDFKADPLVPCHLGKTAFQHAAEEEICLMAREE